MEMPYALYEIQGKRESFNGALTGESSRTGGHASAPVNSGPIWYPRRMARLGGNTTVSYAGIILCNSRPCISVVRSQRPYE